ncbi:beta-barrel assembly-enhancing protease [mine drainage metagenome]|uniref:Beta-barrel assembly-enhancing protease n=1 Tax=mine drainage metagenome TaxID=410659 RepID=A0A1J5TBT1_9ZZZZ
MNTRLKILPAACCFALLSACATNKPVSLNQNVNHDTASWSVAPMATRTSNDSLASMYQIGRYYQGQNRYELAIAAYQRVLAADDGFVEARNGLGVVYSRQGKYREAIEAFQAAIKQAPKAAHIYNNLGYAYYLQGQYTKSVLTLEQATELDPTNLRALNNLGLAYAKKGNNPESVQSFSEAANVAGTHQQSATPMSNASTQIVPLTNVAGITVKPADTIQKEEQETLTLPKDRGVIRPASAVTEVADFEHRVKLVQVSPNVYELDERQHQPSSIPATSVLDSKPISITKVEVANGNGINGMAAKVGKFLRTQGYQAIRLTNQKPFQIHMTQIQYREGYLSEAQILKLSLPESPELVLRNDLRADIGVRLVLGKDIVTSTASFDIKRPAFRLASNEP